MSAQSEVIAWLLETGRITEDQLRGGVFVCRTGDDEDDGGDR